MRRRPPHNDSQDFLLDTICNVLGGIVFIALLIALITGAKSRDLLAGGQPRLEVDPVEIRTLQIEAQSLDDAVAAAQRTLAAVSQPADDKNEAEHDRLTQALREVEHRAAAVEAAHASLSTTSSEAEQELNRIRQEEAQLLEELANLEKVMTEIKAANRMVLRLPQERTSQKRQIAMMLQGGRAYLITHRGVDFTTGLGLDPRDIEFEIRSGREVHVRPSQAGGFNVDGPAPANHPRMRSLIRTCPPAGYFFHFYTWGDSAEAFELLRDAVTAEGYNYNFSLLPPNQPLVLVAVSRSFVQ